MKTLLRWGMALIYANVMTSPQAGNSGVVDNFALAGGRLSVVNCTIVSNGWATGSGLRTASPSLTVATNSIFWWNANDDLNGAFSPAYCAIQTTDAFWTNGLNGCFTASPLFAEPAVQNYRLTAGSPCKDAGFNLAGMAAALDLDGNRRVSGDRIDLGAYEFPASLPATMVQIQ